MASNLLIGNCGVGLTGTISCSRTADSTYGVNNLLGGNKADLFRIATAATGDTRVTLAPLTQQAASFLYVARADLLQASGVGAVTLKADNANNYATATAVYSDASFASAAMVGPQSDDYVATFATTAAYYYWHLNFNSATDSRFPCAKAFIGEAFDPGRDPDTEVVVTRARPTGMRKRSLYTFEISWQGIAYAKAVEMHERFSRPRRHNPVVLFTTGYHDILLGARALFCRVTDMTTPPRATGFCDVKMTAEEVI